MLCSYYTAPLTSASTQLTLTRKIHFNCVSRLPCNVQQHPVTSLVHHDDVTQHLPPSLPPSGLSAVSEWRHWSLAGCHEVPTTTCYSYTRSRLATLTAKLESRPLPFLHRARQLLHLQITNPSNHTINISLLHLLLLTYSKLRPGDKNRQQILSCFRHYVRRPNKPKQTHVYVTRPTSFHRIRSFEERGSSMTD